MTDRPVVFLDVDGTLLPFGPDHGSGELDDPGTWRSTSNPHLEKLRRVPSYDLVRLGAELVWATAWGQDANDVVSPATALGRLPVVEFHAEDTVAVPAALHWKTASLVRYAAGRAFVWLDDEIGQIDRQWVAAAHPGPALLYEIAPRVGVTRSDIGKVQAWLQENTVPPEPEYVPPPLRAIMNVEYDYADGEGVDFEPYAELEPSAQTGWTLRHWTGNPEVTGREIRPFGQDGSGSMVCSWMIREGADLVDQPVVHLGSEGEVAVLAADAWDAMWYFALGHGPHDVSGQYEFADLRSFDPGREVRTHEELVEVAERLAPERRRPAEEIVEDAVVGLPDLRTWVDNLCR